MRRKIEPAVGPFCLTLTQPWASLVGDKLIETRSWRTSYRGPLLIHAAKGFPKEARLLCGQEPFRSRLLALLGIQDADRLNALEIAALLPTSAIVARCCLQDCLEMRDSQRDFIPGVGFDISGDGPLSQDERAFGFYECGRFAWMLQDVVRLASPIPGRGALGLWRPPQEVLVCVGTEVSF